MNDETIVESWGLRIGWAFAIVRVTAEDLDGPNDLYAVRWYDPDADQLVLVTITPRVIAIYDTLEEAREFISYIYA